MCVRCFFSCIVVCYCVLLLLLLFVFVVAIVGVVCSLFVLDCLMFGVVCCCNVSCALRVACFFLRVAYWRYV